MSEEAGPESVPFVAVGKGEKPPWGDDRSCPVCGQPDLPLLATQSGKSITLHYIKHCGGVWLRGPILEKDS